MDEYPMMECDDCDVAMEYHNDVLYKGTVDYYMCYLDITYECPKRGRMGTLTLCYKEYDREWKWDD